LGEVEKIAMRPRWATVAAMPALRRLDQLLSSLGYCSRREAKAYLRHHAVSVEGRPLKDPSLKVEPSSVRIDGQALDHPDGLLVLLHKPPGTVCSHEAAEGVRVYDRLPAQWLRRHPRLESIGRLDKDTTGVLLLTDDGQLNHRWTSPAHHVEKVYEVTVDRPLEAALVERFAAGDLQLEGEAKPCRPARLELLGPHLARLSLTEGKFHQVKRMFGACGWEVTALHRARFGPYELDGLPPGEWRVLPKPSTEGLQNGAMR
jgi:16S rRNA pseudouridine516 synthase